MSGVVVVWVLIVTAFSTGAHSVVIDNIASKADCQRLAAIIREQLRYTPNSPAPATCVAVRKVRP